MIATSVQTVKERKWAQIAINTMGMVSNVLNDVLFLSKIEAGKVIRECSNGRPWAVTAAGSERRPLCCEQCTNTPSPSPRRWRFVPQTFPCIEKAIFHRLARLNSVFQ